MHAWICQDPVGVDALSWAELPQPEPKPGEVLIAIKAASLNFPDLLIVQNKYQIKPPLPFVPGAEYAGVVQAVGEGVTQLRVGQNVACLSGTGGFATHVAAPAALCLPLPQGFSHTDAAAFIMTYATSHLMQKPGAIRKALAVVADYSSEEEHASVCPLCRGARRAVRRDSTAIIEAPHAS